MGFVIGGFFFRPYPYYVLSYPAYYYGRYRVPPATVDRYPVGRAGELAVEVNGNVLRLTWEDGDRPAQEVGLFVADSSQAVLAVQTVETWPYAAVFDLRADIAYVGVTVVYADSTKSTTLVPYTPPR